MMRVIRTPETKIGFDTTAMMSRRHFSLDAIYYPLVRKGHL